jgi:hypothetical protein
MKTYLKLLIIIAGPLGLFLLFALTAYLVNGCTLKEDCVNCTVEVKVPGFPDCLEYDIDAGTVRLCPVDAGAAAEAGE